MLVYRESARVVAVAGEVAALREAMRLAIGQGGLDPAVALLVQFGALESAVMDARWPRRDDDDGLARALRGAGLRLGLALRHAWRDEAAECRAALGRFARHLECALACPGWPAVVSLRVPEGFAYYGLYPETYLAAAAEFARRARPAAVTVVGVRSIGAALSLMVGAELRARGCPVRLFTVRPHGAPFDRRLAITPALAAAWRRDAHVAVVDEGPGLSGSTMAAVVHRLRQLGIAADGIVLFPSWRAPAEQLGNAVAREIWARHAQYVGSFEALWVGSGRLQRAFPAGTLLDLSGGRWRDGGGAPPVQPQHERRKYLLLPATGARCCSASRGWAPLVRRDCSGRAA